MGYFPSGKKGRSLALALGAASGGILHYSEVIAAKQRTRVSKLRNLKGMCHRLSTAQRAVKRTLCSRSKAFSSLTSLVLPSLVLAQEPVEGAKSVVYIALVKSVQGVNKKMNPLPNKFTPFLTNFLSNF